MSHELIPVRHRQHIGPQLQHHLLAELDALFTEIEDGTVKDRTFTGCIALGHRDLPPLNKNRSREIKEAFCSAPATARQSEKAGGIPILTSVINLIRNLWGPRESHTNPVQNNTASVSIHLDRYGRVRCKPASPKDGKQNGQV